MPDPVPVWQLILTSPLDNIRTPATTVCEIMGAQDRVFGFRLNQPSTLSWKMPMSAPGADELLSNPDRLVVLTKNNTPYMTAEISTMEGAGSEDDHSLAVTCTETAWVRLPKALLGRSTTGLTGPASPSDQGQFLMDKLEAYNLTTFSAQSLHTGIGTATAAVASANISGGVWRYKPFLELVQELGASTNGFDFWTSAVDPRAGSAGTALTGQLKIGPLKGTTKAGVVFEYGTEVANAQGYKFYSDNTGCLNAAFALPPSFPDEAGLQVASAAGTGRMAAVGARLEVIPTDLVTLAMRGDIATSNVLIRKYARQLFTIIPAPQDNTGRVPSFPEDFTTGDTIRGRVYDAGLFLVDGLVRVYGVDVKLNDEGLETDELLLVNEA